MQSGNVRYLKMLPDKVYDDFCILKCKDSKGVLQRGNVRVLGQ